MCQKVIIRYANSNCALGLEPVGPCEAEQKGQRCTTLQIVGEKETTIKKSDDHRCDTNPFCHYVYGEGRERSDMRSILSNTPATVTPSQLLKNPSEDSSLDTP
jgi:hypothetical protein